ncbi:MAG: hypothetical protein ACK5LX_09350, partial [Oscillospiraceae bacterium]
MNNNLKQTQREGRKMQRNGAIVLGLLLFVFVTMLCLSSCSNENVDSEAVIEKDGKTSSNQNANNSENMDIERSRKKDEKKDKQDLNSNQDQGNIPTDYEERINLPCELYINMSNTSAAYSHYEMILEVTCPPKICGLTPYNVHRKRVRTDGKTTLKEGVQNGESELHD